MSLVSKIISEPHRRLVLVPWSRSYKVRACWCWCRWEREFWLPWSPAPQHGPGSVWPTEVPAAPELRRTGPCRNPLPRHQVPVHSLTWVSPQWTKHCLITFSLLKQVRSLNTASLLLNMKSMVWMSGQTLPTTASCSLEWKKYSSEAQNPFIFNLLLTDIARF